MTFYDLVRLMPKNELEVIRQSKELTKVLEDMANHIGTIPMLYETDGDDKAVCHLHYFDIQGAADWYIFEVDLDAMEGFGYATLSGDLADPYAEFGYIDLKDFINNPRINLDLYFDGITKAVIKAAKYGDPKPPIHAVPALKLKSNKKPASPKKLMTGWTWNKTGTRQTMICKW
jgi:hypothetical protein